MNPADTELLDVLTSESAWLHGLARSLARDPERAADAAQRTLLTALEHGPEPHASLRAWLATVLRRVLREEHRGDERRSQREQAAHEPRHTPTPEETLARLDVQQRIVAAIRALDEPYRSTLVQRFLDGRSVREIARMSGVPTKTVHTRVERGLVRLRAALDRAHGGDRSAWLGALAALRIDSIGTLAKGAAVMQAGTKAVGLTVALMAVLGTTAWMLAGRESSGEAAQPRAVGAERAASLAGVAHEEASDERSSAQPAGRAAPLSSAERLDEAPTLLRGRVVDADGAGIAGVRLRYVSRRGEEVGPALTDTDASGAFEQPMPEYAAYLHAERAGLASLARPWVRGEAPTEELAIVLVPAAEVAGIVTDEAGVPIAGARVRIVFPDSAFHAHTSGTWVFGRPPFETSSEVPSGFSIAEVPLVAGALIQAELDGYLRAELELDGLDRGQVELVLRGAQADAPTVSGVVLDVLGAPVAGAQVSDGQVVVRTDPRGRFTLEPHEPTDEVELCAILRGAMPARQLVTKTNERFPPVTLRLGDAPLSIEGRVVDELGEPVIGAIVQLLDPTRFGIVALERGGQRYSQAKTVEQLAISESAASQRSTQRFGSLFELHGLLPRGYQVIALDPRTLASTGPLRIEAGTHGVVLRLNGVGPRRAVAGRVLDRRGHPLAGVGVRIGRHLAGKDLSDGYPAEVETDTDGRFMLEPLHVQDAYLVLSGRRLFPKSSYELSADQELEAIELVAGLECAARVRCADLQLADAFEFQDEQGAPLYTSFEAPGASFMGLRRDLVEGDSGNVRTDDRAAQLVLFRDDEEVYRGPVELSPGEENVLRVP